MLSLSPGIRRILALAILAVLVLLGAEAIAWVVGERQAAIDGADELHTALARRQQAADKVARLGAELEALKQHQTSAVGFLQSANESLAAAELQSRVKTALDAARGELRSTQSLPDREENGFHRVAIRGQIAVDLAQLQRVFYQLESGTPFLFLDNVEIRARQPARGSKQTDNSNPILDVRFDLYGYLRRAT